MPDDADTMTAQQNFEEDAQDVKRELGAIVREDSAAAQHRLAADSPATSKATAPASAWHGSSEGEADRQLPPGSP